MPDPGEYIHEMALSHAQERDELFTERDRYRAALVRIAGMEWWASKEHMQEVAREALAPNQIEATDG